MTIKDKKILLIISGGIAAYKSLELIRLLKKAGARVTCILTKGGEQFVTPLSVSALSENEVHTDLWSLKDESEMRHIRLTREADIILIAPASANLLAKLATGIADDLASTTLLASDKPAIIAPAMNHQMWHNSATQENIAKLILRGSTLIPPTEGDMACGEYGVGRMAEPQDIVNTLTAKKKLSGLKALVTAGPTYEPIDPVRFIGNRSSGKQGYAIAETLSKHGADVTLVSGPVSMPAPQGINLIRVETAQDMLTACENALPADIAVCAAAVSDWSPSKSADNKIKKIKGQDAPSISLKENPDILKTISNHNKRPTLVIGFAAETQNLQENAKAKLDNKNCDMILANLVHGSKESVFGSEQNHIYLIDKHNSHDWGAATKQQHAEKLCEVIINNMKDRK